MASEDTATGAIVVTRHWLDGIGLGRYADLFAEHRIGLDVLGDLTEADLAELGLRLGDRKRLLRAIPLLRGASQGNAATDAGASAPPRTPAAAERRQLTVMFCDMVGSTALSEQFDPAVIVNAGGVAQREDRLWMAALEGDEQPFELSPGSIHEVMELIRKNQSCFTRMKQIAGVIDPKWGGTLHDGDQLEPVVIVRTDTFRLQRRRVGALKEDDVIRREGLVDAAAREEARRWRELPQMSLQLRKILGSGLHQVFMSGSRP